MGSPSGLGFPRAERASPTARSGDDYIYFTATLDAASWGAQLAVGEGRGRIYVVEPTGEFEDDPNATDKRFPGNPTRWFRTREPLRVVGEIVDSVGHSPETLEVMLRAAERPRI